MTDRVAPAQPAPGRNLSLDPVGIDQLARVRRGTRAWWMAAVLAGLFFLAHVPFMASTLEDVDSVNFALGLRHFDPGQHRPHPPGYPIYMALGKVANTVLSEPHALAIWGVLFGALSAFSLLRLFACLDALDGSARADAASPDWLGRWIAQPAMAVLLTMTAPLFWMTASRPMSDMAGFAVSLASQAVLLTAMVRKREAAIAGTGTYDAASAARSGRLVLLGAFLAAAAIGFRSQAAWLTLPLLVLVIFDRAGRGAAGALIGSGVWLIVGSLLWFVPLVIASGGPGAYYTALTSQAGEDWSGVDLLATNFGLRRLAFALYETLVRHWDLGAWVILACAAIGAVVLLWQGRRALLVIIAAFVPYAVFHLLFQETVTTRYAMPLVVPLAYLATRGIYAFKRWHTPVIGVLTAILFLALVVPVSVQYGRQGSPVARALDAVRANAGTQPGIAVGMHFPFVRPVEADSVAPAVALKARPKHEWLSLVDRWLAGQRGPVWFLADPKRTDLALIDPQACLTQGEYVWPFSSQVYLGGIRPDRVRWVVIREPGWFAAEGWHLTPETAGVAEADGRGLDHGAITAWLARRAWPVELMIGGRHLGKGAGPAARVSVRIDGREIENWLVSPADTSFLRYLALPAGTLAGEGQWARLDITAVTSDTGQATGVVAIDQFDAQDQTTAMLGFGEGWQEPEYNPSTGLAWRWASGKSSLRISAVDRDVELRITGESPMKYFVRPSRVVVSAGAHQVLSLAVGEDFSWTARIPASALKDAAGVITLETDQTFRPADRGASADKRALGLRIYSVKVRQVS